MSKYEFSENQNKVIRGVAIRCITQCFLLASIGVLIALQALVKGATNLPIVTTSFCIQGACSVLMGIVFIRPARNLKNIVATKGKDIPELMIALRKLAVGLTAIVILIIVTVIMDFVMLASIT